MNDRWLLKKYYAWLLNQMVVFILAWLWRHHSGICLILWATKTNHYSLAKLKASELNGNSILTIGVKKWQIMAVKPWCVDPTYVSVNVSNIYIIRIMSKSFHDFFTKCGGFFLRLLTINGSLPTKTPSSKCRY